MSVMVIKDDYDDEAELVEIPVKSKKEAKELKKEHGNRDVAYALEKAGYKVKKSIFRKELSA